MKSVYIGLIAGACFGAGIVIGYEHKTKAVEEHSVTFVPASVSVVTTSPDDQGPQEKKLAQEASVHASAAPTATSSPTTSSSAPPPPAGPPAPTEPRRWQDAGVLVLTPCFDRAVTKEDAEETASSARYYLSHSGARGWTNHVEAIHIYGKVWATRVSPLVDTEAKALCAWLDAPQKTELSWLKTSRCSCRFTASPTLTMHTLYTDLMKP